MALGCVSSGQSSLNTSSLSRGINRFRLDRDRPDKDYKFESMMQILASLGKWIAALEEFTGTYPSLVHNKINASSPLFGSTMLENVLLDSRTRPISRRKLRKHRYGPLFLGTTETEDGREPR